MPTCFSLGNGALPLAIGTSKGDKGQAAGRISCRPPWLWLPPSRAISSISGSGTKEPMQAFTTMTGLVAVLDRVNVDTDQIIPKQFLKTIKRTGLREGLFFDWRKKKDGFPDAEFFLNQPRYQGATILLTRDNFGCGSSREHAPWALLDQGFRCVIAPSFADIFYNNCFQNGILPVVLKVDEVQVLIRTVLETPGYQLTVDLGS